MTRSVREAGAASMVVMALILDARLWQDFMERIYDKQKIAACIAGSKYHIVLDTLDVDFYLIGYENDGEKRKGGKERDDIRF